MNPDRAHRLSASRWCTTSGKHRNKRCLPGLLAPAWVKASIAGCTEVRVPNRVSDGTDMQRIFNPLFKVTLPGDMEQDAGSPEEDDCQVTEVGSKNLLVKILLRHAIVAFKVVCLWRSRTRSDEWSGLGQDPG